MTPDKLSRATKLAYGAGDLGAAIVTAINGFFLLNFLINVAGLRPGMAGNIFLIVKIWDAVNDPIIGWLTDHTVSKLGRRRPWLLIAAIPFARHVLPAMGRAALRRRGKVRVLPGGGPVPGFCLHGGQRAVRGADRGADPGLRRAHAPFLGAA